MMCYNREKIRKNGRLREGSDRITYKKSKETNDRIVAVARKLFYEKGFKKTSVRQICKDAGINHSLIYYYFKSGKYGIAQYLINEHIRKCIKALSKHYSYQSDYLLYHLLLLRFLFREISQDPIELECYINAWEEEQIDRPFSIETYTIAKGLGMNVSYTDVQTAVLMSDYVWKGLYEAKQNGILELTDSEIRKRTDLTRWMNIGLDKAFILEKIAVAEEILKDIPIYHIHLILEDG